MKRLLCILFFGLLFQSSVLAAQLTIAVTGDDYTDAAQFQSDAQSVQQTIMGMTPYVSRPQDLLWKPVFTTKDLGCHVGWLDRVLTCDFSAITTALQGVSYNQIIVLVNTSTYGGSGGSDYAACYNGDPRVCAHEFGHTLAGLLDEYILYGVGVTYESLNKNCYQSLNDPIHYPYAGCKYTNWSRAYPTCLMKELSSGFCPLCQGLVSQVIDRYVTGTATGKPKKGKGPRTR